MQPPGPMGPGGQMPGMDITALMQRYAQMQGGQSAPFAQQGPGMQNMSPDQGMNQAPPGMGIPQPPGGQLPPGVAETMRGFGMGQPGGMPMPKPMMNPGGNMEGRPGMGGMPGSYPGGFGPFMPPGMEPGQGQMFQKPMLRPPMGGPGMGTPPQQAQPPRMPPQPRMPPGAGVYQNPLTKKMMNETPIFSGQNNPANMKQDQPLPATPSTGGVMNGPADDRPQDPIRVAPNPMVASSDKIRPKQQGAPPFNPNGSGVSAQAPTEPGMVNQPWQQKENRKKGLARAMTSRVTKSATR